MIRYNAGGVFVRLALKAVYVYIGSGLFISRSGLLTSRSGLLAELLPEGLSGCVEGEIRMQLKL